MVSGNKNVLNVMDREDLGTSASRKCRREGKVPAVIYGHGAKPKHFIMDVKEWAAIARQDSQIVDLKTEKGKTLTALIKDVQFDYLNNSYTHVDFLEVKMDEEITASVPIHTHGTPVGLSQGGVLDQQLHEIEVQCTPRTLPEIIEVDVSELELEASICIGDLEFPEGVTPILEADQTVCHVMIPRVEEEPEEGALEGEEGLEGGEGAEGEAGAEGSAEGGDDQENKDEG